MSSVPVYVLNDVTFRDTLVYRNAAGAGVTGKVQGDFTINLSKDGVGNQATTGITITEIDASNNAGDYELEYNGASSFVAVPGTYCLTIFDTANPTYSWTQTYVVSSGSTFTGTAAAFTATASDGRVTDGSAPLAGVTVTLRRADGTIETQVESDASGLWGPVYLTESVTAYAQKAGYSQAVGQITVSGSTATGPGSDMELAVSSVSANLAASALFAYARRMCRDRVGTRSDEVIKQIVNSALATIARESQSNHWLKEGQLDIHGAYSTGTIAITTDTATVTLTAGTFPTWATSGVLRIGSKLYQIASRDSATQLTLSATYRGETLTASTYDLWHFAYDLPDDMFQLHQIFYGQDWTWGDTPIGFAEFTELKHEWLIELSGSTAWTIAAGALQLWPAPAVDTTITYAYRAKPAYLTSGGDVADFPAANIDVLYKAIDYEVALRFGDTEGMQTASDALRVYQKALQSMASNDLNMPRRVSPIGMGRGRRPGPGDLRIPGQRS